MNITNQHQHLIQETGSKPITAAIESSYLSLVESMTLLRAIERSGWGNRKAITNNMMDSFYALYQLTRHKLDKGNEALIFRIGELMKENNPNTKEAFELADQYQGMLFNAGILSARRTQ